MLLNGQNEKNCVNEKFNEFIEEKKTVQEILRRYRKDDSIRIVKMECGAGSKQGDNYMSVVKQVNVKFKSGENFGK